MPGMAGAHGRRHHDLLRDLSEGRQKALDELMPLVYGELRAIARRYLRRERVGHTLDTTALVHEAYLKLVDIDAVDYRDRGHFYAVASRRCGASSSTTRALAGATKRGGARAARAARRGGAMTDEQADELLALDEALDRPRGAGRAARTPGRAIASSAD